VLPHHQRWATFLMRLQYVVVDELHVLRGVFGTHVAHLLRRLRRLCAHYGAEPTFVFSSATIGQPGRLASQLCGQEVAEITEDGSPRGRRTFVLWNPTVELAGADTDATGTGPTDSDRTRRPSANRQTAAIMAELIRQGRRTIAFCRSRKGTELVAAEVRRRLPPDLADRVRPYRGGYLTGERRLIESELFGGQLRGVVATTALELGIDVGGLDACVLDGFPGTIASMWQQAGRAGRQAQDAIVVLVAGDDQLDQWLMSHPDQVFARAPESAVINPANPYVLNAHLACAAYERPLSHGDERWWPGVLDEGVRALVVDDRLKIRPRRFGGRQEPMAVWAARGWPSHAVGLRNGSSHEVRIALADGTLIGTVDHGRAGHMVHPGAIYLHQGQTYQVAQLDLDDGAAIVAPSDGGEWTQPRSVTDITILEQDRTRRVGASQLSLGAVQVSSQVVGYRRFDSATGELLGSEELFLPPGELTTRAFWYTVDPAVLAEAGISPTALGGTLHAAEHAAIGLLPLFTICDRWDVGGVSTPFQLETGLPTIVIYDGYPGGAGIAELGYDNADRHLEATLEVIESCPCESGCPSCVQSPKCGNGNEPLDKAGSIAMLRAITTLIAPSS
jgi:DEAD/DEAH box helicase domain-containing protein